MGKETIFGWYNEGFNISWSGEKGKDTLSGLFFSAVFLAYSVWELINIIKSKKTYQGNKH